MAFAHGKLRVQAPLQANAYLPARPAPVASRATGPKALPIAVVSLKANSGRWSKVQRLYAAAADEQIELSLPAAEILQTLKITQRKDGMFIIEDVIEGSTADSKSVKKGSVLKAVSDPVAPGNMWELEPRSDLRHVLDQMRMQQSSTVNLQILPPSAAEQEAGGRIGFDKGTPNEGGAQSRMWNQRIDDSTMQRRQQQREAYLSKEGTTNSTNWLALAVGTILVPSALILGYAIQSGFLDEMNSGWRQGL